MNSCFKEELKDLVGFCLEKRGVVWVCGFRIFVYNVLIKWSLIGPGFLFFGWNLKENEKH